MDQGDLFIDLGEKQFESKRYAEKNLEVQIRRRIYTNSGIKKPLEVKK
jgi:hypothetical protein